MECPSCHAAIVDPDAAFCPRCGKALGAPEAESTTELRVEPTGSAHETPGTGTKQLEIPGEARGASLMEGFLPSLRRAVRKGGWGSLSLAAAFGFLGMLASAALLILGVKMQYPEIGSGSDPLAALSGLVIVALGVLRVPIHIGDLTASALPLGALLFVGYLAAWATARALRPRAGGDTRRAVGEGVKLAAPFAVICFVASLVFRIRSGPSPVAADAWGALVLGALWGSVFGTVGGLLATGTVKEQAKALLGIARSRWEFVYHGVLAAGVMLGVSLVAGAVAALLWVIAALLGGGPENFGLGEAGAAIIYLAAFAPNVIISIVSIGLGAPVEIGAQVSSSGRLIGPLAEVSLFEWGGGSPPWFAYLLLLIPVGACLAGGFAARSSARRGATETSKLMMPTIAAAAVTYSFVLFELAALAEARLGAGLIRNRGFGRVAPEAGTVLLLAFFWALALGLAGWKLGESGALSPDGGDGAATSGPAGSAAAHGGTPPLS